MAGGLTSAVVGTYNYIYDIYYGTEKAKLAEQLEEVNNQLQQEKNHNSSQAKRVSELSTKLESEVKENKCLWDQIEYLTIELHKVRQWTKHMDKEYQAEKNKAHEAHLQKEELIRQLNQELAHKTTQKKMLCLKHKEELKKLSASHKELEDALKAATEKIKETKRQLAHKNIQKKWLSLKYKEELDEEMMKQQVLCEEMEHERKAAAERERNLHVKLEELKVKLHQETSTNLELVAKLKAEEEGKQTLLNDCNQEKMELAKNLEETKRQLAHKNIQKKWLSLKHKEELEIVNASYKELQDVHFKLCEKHNSVEKMYDDDMNAATEKINSLEKQLESQIKYNSVHDCEVTENKEQLEMMKQQVLHEEMEHERKAAAERERNLHVELEELKVKLHQETSTNLELVAKLKAEEEGNQTLLNDCNQEKMELAKKLEETKHQLAHQQSQENLLGAKLEKLTAAYTRLHKAAFIVHDACNNVEEKCGAEIKAEEEKTKAAVERENTLRIELEELKVNLHQETSTNLELVAKLKAEEEGKQDLHTNSVQIMEELKVEVNWQREESPSTSHKPEHVEEAPSTSHEPEHVEEAPSTSHKPEHVEEAPSTSHEPEHVEEAPSTSHEPEHVEEEAPSTSHEPEHVEEEAHVTEEKVPEKKKKKSLLWFKKKKRQQSPHPPLTLTNLNK
ncbi:hypothetical protein PAMP_014812 [Pampus punctatissimus]